MVALVALYNALTFGVAVIGLVWIYCYWDFCSIGIFFRAAAATTHEKNAENLLKTNT